jgi:nucleoside-diphosphate-sugar epimerase
MKVLITGAAGQVASGVVEPLSRYFDLRLSDVKPSGRFAEYDWIIGSILDIDFLHEAMKDVQAIINFTVVRPEADDAEATAQTFDVNVKGLYFLLEAAEQAGIERFVHVSSTAPVIGHWYEGTKVTVNSALTTRGRYSLAKALQEVICAHIARNSNMRVVVLRPWHPTEVSAKPDYHPGLISAEDFAEACRLAIDSTVLGQFEIFHAVATQEARERFDAERTEHLLGFRAKEDFHELLSK